jgi:hypothetical protein
VRENRQHGSEGGEATSLPYPYRSFLRAANKNVDGRDKPTSVWHGLCLSCRLLAGGMSTHMAAPLRRTGCT